SGDSIDHLVPIVRVLREVVARRDRLRAHRHRPGGRQPGWCLDGLPKHGKPPRLSDILYELSGHRKTTIREGTSLASDLAGKLADQDNIDSHFRPPHWRG